MIIYGDPREVMPDLSLAVLGSGNGPDGVTPRTAARIDGVLDHLKQASDVTHIFSGGVTATEGHVISEAQAMLQYAAQNGVNTGNIVLETSSTNTVQNILGIRCLALALGLERLGIVTDKPHIPRVRSITDNLLQGICTVDFVIVSNDNLTVRDWMREPLATVVAKRVTGGFTTESVTHRDNQAAAVKGLVKKMIPSRHSAPVMLQ